MVFSAWSRSAAALIYFDCHCSISHDIIDHFVKHLYILYVYPATRDTFNQAGSELDKCARYYLLYHKHYHYYKILLIVQIHYCYYKCPCYAITCTISVAIIIYHIQGAGKRFQDVFTTHSGDLSVLFLSYAHSKRLILHNTPRRLALNTKCQV